MIKYVVFLFMLSLLSLANSAEELQDILLNSIYDELLVEMKDVKPPKFLSKKNSINNGGRGRLIIERMKQKNLEKLAKLRGVDPSQVKSGKDIVKLSKKQNKELITYINKEIKNMDDWRNLANEEVLELKKKIIADWRVKHKAKLLQWEIEEKKFKKNKDKYKNTTFDLPLVLKEEQILKPRKQVIKIDKEHRIIDHAFDSPIRDQQFRPTCASFAGIRAIEIKLSQLNKNWDLSEQYFYWASKDNCREKKCSRRGSWVGHGLKYSQGKNELDIPLEKNCPYFPISKPGNETQIPLNSGCRKGVVKVRDYILFQEIDEIVNQMDQGNPVIASVELTPNFYTSRSIVTFKNHLIGKKMDSHSSGHALILVGYLKLPQVLNEGRVCFIAANSWGEGWGKGGHSCLTEKWLFNQKQINPFVSVDKIKI